MTNEEFRGGGGRNLERWTCQADSSTQSSIWAATWSNQDEMAGAVMLKAWVEWRGQRPGQASQSAAPPVTPPPFSVMENTPRQQVYRTTTSFGCVSPHAHRGFYFMFWLKQNKTCLRLIFGVWPPCVWSLLLLFLRSTRRPPSATSSLAAARVPGKRGGKPQVSINDNSCSWMTRRRKQHITYRTLLFSSGRKRLFGGYPFHHCELQQTTIRHSVIKFWPLHITPLLVKIT